jgi:ABC-type oligopeptide transport system ATPase subunit
MTPVLAAQGLTRHFGGERFLGFGKPSRLVRAVDGVSFALPEGKTLSLVGESGCGKTTTARMLLRLMSPSAGKILFEGESLAAAAPATLLRYRLADAGRLPGPLQLASARGMRARGDPRRAAPAEHPPRQGRRRHRAPRSPRLMDPASRLSRVAAVARCPHEFSGGQRQRICHRARASSCRPGPGRAATSPSRALDVSVPRADREPAAATCRRNRPASASC